MQYVVPDYFLAEHPCNEDFVTVLTGFVTQKNTSKPAPVTILEREEDVGYKIWTLAPEANAEGWFEASQRAVLPFSGIV